MNHIKTIVLMILLVCGQVAIASYDNGGGLDYIPSASSLGIRDLTAPEALSLNGNFALKDQAGAASATLGYGKLYNNNGDLYYLNGSTAYLVNNMDPLASSIAADSLDFSDFKDIMSLDANTDITMANGDLNFDSDTFFIDSSANNIGVATSTPGYELEVVGTVGATYFNGDGAGISNIGANGLTADTLDFAQFRDTMTLDTTTNITMANGDMNFDSNSLVIDSSTNRIGFGNTAPAAQLHVDADAVASANANAEILMTSVNNYDWIFGVDNGDTNKFKISNGNNLAADPAITILNNGDVGINTTAPGEALEVSGTVKATAFSGGGSNLTTLPTEVMELDHLSDAKAGRTSNDPVYIGQGAGNSDSGNGASSSAAVGIGYEALKNNDSGDQRNTAVGYRTLMSSDGDDNTAMGYLAMDSTSTGSSNIAIGSYALQTNATGNNNVALGFRASDLSTGSNNIAIGYRAGANITGSNNIMIGYNINGSTAGIDNGLSIGNLIFGTDLDGTDKTISSGNVGIGYNSPSSKLQVNGQVLATSFNGDGSALTGVPTSITADSLDFSDFKDIMSLDANTDITMANGDLNFDSDTFFIDSSENNVGVATSTPGYELEVVGTVGATYFNGDGAGISNIGANGLTADTLDFAQFRDTMTLDTTTNITMANGDMNFDSNSLVIDSSTNRIGFGNTAPAAQLHVDADAVASANANAEILMTSVNNYDWIFGIDNGDTNKFKISNGNNLAADPAITILNNGDVGINTTTPGEALEVSGTVKATAFSGGGSNLTTLPTEVMRLDHLSDAMAGITSNDPLYIGTSAGDSDNSGSSSASVGIGYEALKNNDTGDQRNTAVGYRTLLSNDGDDNTAMGYLAMDSTSTGSSNIAIGSYALQTNATGNNNVALGFRASDLSTGSNNIAIGYRAGANITGSNNIMIGYNINGSTAGIDNGLSIGNLIFGTDLDGTDKTISSGNVGIGYNSPSSKLQVNGQVLATSFNGDGSALTGVPTSITADSLDFSDFKDIMSLDANTDITMANGDLNFDSDTFFIDSSENNVGVATSTPGYELEVVGTVGATYFNGDGAGISNIGANGLTADTLDFAQFRDTMTLDTTTNITMANGDMNFDSNSLVIDSSTNRIGFGNTAPAAQLHVDADAVASANANAEILMTSVNNYDWIFGIDNGDTNKFKISNGNNLAADPAITILNNGDVGINTTTPGEALEVSGTVKATAFSGGGSNLTTLPTEVMRLDHLSDAMAGITSNDPLYIGTSAGDSDNSGSSSASVGIGYEALKNNDTGDQRNTAVGYRTLLSNDGDDNTAMGYLAMDSTGAGSSNIAIGSYALQTNSTGNNNVALGFRASDLSTGSNNIAIGYRAGANITGSNNIMIGYNINGSTAGIDNGLSIGNLIFGTDLDGTDKTISSGNVGIGYNSPSSKLQVNGQVLATSFNGDGSALTNLTTSSLTSATSNQVLYVDGSNNVAGDPDLTFDGTITYALTIRTAVGTNGSPTHSFNSDTDTGMYRIASNHMGFTTGGTQRMSISSAGNVGIGIQNPSRKLEVVGGIFAEDSILMNGANSSTSSVGYGFWGDDNCGLHHPQDDYVSLVTSGSERLKISNGGTAEFFEIVQVDRVFLFDDEPIRGANGATSTFTVDWDDGNRQYIVLNGTNMTVNFSNPNDNAPGNFVLVVEQDDTGGRTVSTWDSDIKWPGGTAPTISSGANDIDLISCFFRINDNTSNAEYLCIPHQNFD